MKKHFINGMLLTCVCALCFCNSSHQIEKASADKKGLKDYFKNYFAIGASVMPQNLNGDEAVLILEQFSSLTPENSMKMAPIHPEENRFNWSNADSIVSFAARHGLKLRGHTLCWHNQA